MQHQRTSITRTVGELRNVLEHGHVAFYLGSGIDNFLIKNTHPHMKFPPGWDELVKRLYFNTDDISKYKWDKLTEEGYRWNKFFADWQAEIATYAHWRLGDKEFHKKVSSINNHKFDCNKTDNIQDLCSLLSKSNLLLTTNYTEYIKKAMKATYPDRDYFILDREDLDGYIFPEPVSPQEIKTVYIIHIHGRASVKSIPILDAWGYNVAQFDDENYSKLFRALFLSRHVITIGVSWTDAPLRNASGFIERKYPYLGRSHLGFFFKQVFPQSKNGIDPQISWMNVMNAVYGVNSVIVDNRAMKTITKELNEPLDLPDDEMDLARIADFLDSTGDYESQVQHEWFVYLGRIGKPNLRSSEASEKGVMKVMMSLKSIIESDNLANWIVSAKIERHLRHQLYLYPPSGKDRNLLRQEIWNLLFEGFKRNNFLKKITDEYLLFDFLTGGFEIGNLDTSFFPHRLFRKNDILNNRLKIATEIWKPAIRYSSVLDFKDALDKYEDLGLRLLDVGWESMAAKVLSDRVFLMARGMNSFKREKGWIRDGKPLLSIADLMSETLRVEKIAKVTGSFRRRIKVDVLNALWNTNPKSARLRLLAHLQANNQEDTNLRIEPAMINAIGIGLVFTYLRMAKSELKNNEIMKTAYNTLEEAGFTEPEKTLQRDNINFWKPIIPQDQKNEISVIQNKLIP